jgi:hypothetical protein
MPSKKKSKVSSHKHFFHFRLPTGTDTKSISIPVKVRYATKPVTITLTAEHVRKAIDAEGYGNTQTCVMAQCIKHQAEVFPHEVDGYVDWTYGRAYVVSKVNKKTNLPSECICYKHNDDIAKNFDEKKEDGVLELWKELRDNGPRTVTLYPLNVRTGEHKKVRKHDPRPRTSPKRYQPRGAALRYGIVKLGLIDG